MRGLLEPGADLISRGQLCAVHILHIWRRAEPPPLPPAWRYLPGMLAAQHASGARFWGQPAPPPAPGPRAGGGPRPARISWLLPPLAAPVAPGQAWGSTTTGKGDKTWPSPGGAQWCLETSGAICPIPVPHCKDEGRVLERSGTLSRVMRLSPVVWPRPLQILISVFNFQRSVSAKAQRSSRSVASHVWYRPGWGFISSLPG